MHMYMYTCIYIYIHKYRYMNLIQIFFKTTQIDVTCHSNQGDMSVISTWHVTQINMNVTCHSNQRDMSLKSMWHVTQINMNVTCHTSLLGARSELCVHACLSVCLCMCLCTRVCVRVCVYVCAYTCVCPCVSVSVSVMCVCVSLCLVVCVWETHPYVQHAAFIFMTWRIRVRGASISYSVATSLLLQFSKKKYFKYPIFFATSSLPHFLSGS